MEDFGYRLFKRNPGAPVQVVGMLDEEREHEPGYAVLEAQMRDLPTEHHFDPLYFSLQIAVPGGMCETVIEHPWPGEATLRVCAGAIDLIDRKGKRLDAFTFGGTLHIQPEDEVTLVRFSSPAPILVEEGYNSFEGLMTDEVEIILAARRAAWGNDCDGFEARLAAAEPLGLYFGCLRAVLARLESNRSADEQTTHLKHVLRDEIAALETNMPFTYRLEIEAWL